MIHKNTILFIGALTAITVLLGINYFTTPYRKRRIEKSDFSNEEPVEEISPDTEPRSSELILEELTPEQKIAQMIAYPVVIDAVSGEREGVVSNDLNQPTGESAASPAANLAQEGGEDFDADQAAIEDKPSLDQAEAIDNQAVDDQIVNFEPGLITIFGSNISYKQAEQLTQFIDASFSNKTLTPLIAVDHEGGSVQRLSGEGFLHLPDWADMCRLEEEALTEQLVQSAQELQQAGVNIVFAPVVDIGGSVLGKRACQNVEEILPSASDYIRIFGLHQIMPVIKHYPGIGNASRDLHKEPDEIRLNPDSILIYTNLLDIYPNIGVMTAHIQLVDRFEGLPCSLSRLCLNPFAEKYQDILVFSDALNMGALEALIDAGQAGPANEAGAVDDASQTAVLADSDSAEKQNRFADLAAIAQQAVLAGNDVLVFGPDVTTENLQSILNKLAEVYRSDPEFAQQVDASVNKIIKLKSIN